MKIEAANRLVFTAAPSLGHDQEDADRAVAMITKAMSNKNLGFVSAKFANSNRGIGIRVNFELNGEHVQVFFYRNAKEPTLAMALEDFSGFSILHPPTFGYRDILDEFKPEGFNAAKLLLKTNQALPATARYQEQLTNVRNWVIAFAQARSKLASL